MLFNCKEWLFEIMSASGQPFSNHSPLTSLIVNVEQLIAGFFFVPHIVLCNDVCKNPRRSDILMLACLSMPQQCHS